MRVQNWSNEFLMKISRFLWGWITVRNNPHPHGLNDGFSQWCAHKENIVEYLSIHRNTKGYLYKYIVIDIKEYRTINTWMTKVILVLIHLVKEHKKYYMDFWSRFIIFLYKIYLIYLNWFGYTEPFKNFTVYSFLHWNNLFYCWSLNYFTKYS